MFEEVTGRRFRVRHVPSTLLRLASVLLRPLSERFHSLMALAATMDDGDTIDMAAVRAEFSIPLTSVEDYAKQCATLGLR